MFGSVVDWEVCGGVVGDCGYYDFCDDEGCIEGD